MVDDYLSLMVSYCFDQKKEKKKNNGLLLTNIFDRKAVEMLAWILLTLCNLEPFQENETFTLGAIIQHFLPEHQLLTD